MISKLPTGEGFAEDCGQLSLYFRTFSNIAGMFGYKTNLSVVITDELLQPTLDTEEGNKPHSYNDH